MASRTWIILSLGLVVAIGTAVSIKNRMGDKPAEAPKGTQVIIAATDISAGTFVRSESQLALADWPKENITDSMLTSDVSKPGDFNGAVARRAIGKGEPIVKNLLVKSSEGGFMSAVLEPGKRAVSIAVDSTTGNAGFIFPGDHVDLILTLVVSKARNDRRVSETFIEDARVLAVDQSIDNPDNKAMIAKTVTLEVTPHQAEEINLAKDLGKISLSLRSLANRGRLSTDAQSPIPAPVVDPNAPVVPPAPAANPAPAAENTGDTAPAPVPTPPAEPQANVTPPPEAPHTTRDSDVSKLVSPQEVVNTRVQVIRGNERTEIQFGPADTGNHGE